MSQENYLGDDANLQLAQATHEAVVNDIASGNLMAAQNDLGKLQGNVSNPLWHDPSYASQAQALLGDAQARVNSATPQQLQDNQSAWDARTSDVMANVSNLNTDETYQAVAARERADIKAGQDAAAAGQDPALAYNGIPDIGGFGTALNLSGQSPHPGISGLTAGGIFALGGTTLLLTAIVVVIVGVWARGAHLI